MTRWSRRMGIVVLALVEVLVLTAGVLVAGASTFAVPLDHDGPYVLLVLGSDEGPPRSGDALHGRADGFHLLVVSEDRVHVSIVSFPRDTWTDVPGFGRSKINASLTGGPERAVATAEAISGLVVDDWIVTNFHGFMSAVEDLGGVNVDVEQRLYDPRGADSDLQPGEQLLNGYDALSYVRDRHSRPRGDLDRAESHGRFLQALHAQLVAEAPGAGRITELIALLDRTTATSIPLPRLFSLAVLAMRIDPANVQRERLDANTGTAGSQSVVRLTDSAHRVLADLSDGLLGNE